MPWFGDFGILYYRTDLLRKCGYKSPPTTWTQLFTMAKKIQDGEQQDNANSPASSSKATRTRGHPDGSSGISRTAQAGSSTTAR